MYLLSHENMIIEVSEIHIYLSIYLSIIYLSIIYVSIIYLSMYVSIYVSINHLLSIIYVSIYQSSIYHVSPSIYHLSMYLFMYLSIIYYLSLYLSLYVYHLSSIYVSINHLSIIYYLSLYLSMSIYHLSSIYVSINHLSIIYLSSIYLSMYLLYLYIYLSIIYLSIYVSMYLSTIYLYLSVYLCMYLSMYLLSWFLFPPLGCTQTAKQWRKSLSVPVAATPGHPCPWVCVVHSQIKSLMPLDQVWPQDYLSRILTSSFPEHTYSLGPCVQVSHWRHLQLVWIPSPSPPLPPANCQSLFHLCNCSPSMDPWTSSITWVLLYILQFTQLSLCSQDGEPLFWINDENRKVENVHNLNAFYFIYFFNIFIGV